MRFVFFFLFPICVFGQVENYDSISYPKNSFELQNSYLFSFPKKYEGSFLTFSYFYAINKRHRLGVEIGGFYNQVKDENNMKMKYAFFPIFLTYKYKLRNNFVKIECGTNVISFFDSDYYYKFENNKNFWPTYSEVLSYETFDRRKHFLILTTSINFRLAKGLFLMNGLTFYLGNELDFCHLNLGLSYRII